VFTIASGVAGMALIPFIVGLMLGCGARFFLVAGLMYWGGAELEQRLHRVVDVLGWALVFILIVGYLIFS
jgi:membrane protein DedA with SNARE-associated domain